ncbi:MAG TPA: hypothetical protein VF582_05850 [Allosphingosinicella sp.]
MILRPVPGSNAPVADGFADDLAGPVIELALAGDKDARETLKRFTRARLDAKRPIPCGLATYLARLEVEGAAPSRPGKHPDTFAPRDLMLPGAIWLAVKDGFKPHRSRARHHEATDAAPSAMAIVKEVLEEFGVHLTESAIEDIWNGRDRALFEELEEELLQGLPPELRQKVRADRGRMSRTI